MEETALRKHNTYRAKHGAPPVVWNAGVESAAARWVARCVFEHEPDSPYGENLFASWGQGLSEPRAAEAAITAWYNEVGKYDFSNPGFSGETGHFTAVVWRASTAIGCAMKACGSMTILACKYSPPGNVLGQFPQNVHPPG